MSLTQQNNAADCGIMGSKMCNTCGKLQPLTEFHKDRRTKDGHLYKCRTCVSEYKQKQRIKRGLSRFSRVNWDIVVENKKLAKNHLKKCTQCKEILPLSEFHNSTTNGKASHCKSYLT